MEPPPGAGKRRIRRIIAYKLDFFAQNSFIAKFHFRFLSAKKSSCFYCKKSYSYYLYTNTFAPKKALKTSLWIG